MILPEIFPTLKTNRLLLRQVTNADSPALLFLRSNEEVNRFVQRTTLQNIKEAEAFVARITSEFSNNETVTWAITLKGSLKLIGSICLWNFSPDGKIGEVGYDLHPDHQKQGIMTEALQVVLKFGFEKLNLIGIEAYTQSDNMPSRSMLVRNGFQLAEGKLDKDNPKNLVFNIHNPNRRAS